MLPHLRKQIGITWGTIPIKLIYNDVYDWKLPPYEGSNK